MHALVAKGADSPIHLGLLVVRRTASVHVLLHCFMRLGIDAIAGGALVAVLDDSTAQGSLTPAFLVLELHVVVVLMAHAVVVRVAQQVAERRHVVELRGVLYFLARGDMLDRANPCVLAVVLGTLTAPSRGLRMQACSRLLT